MKRTQINKIIIISYMITLCKKKKNNIITTYKHIIFLHFDFIFINIIDKIDKNYYV